MQRIVRLMAVLDDGGAHGVSAERLIEVADYGEKDPASQLGRDLRHLRAQGWQIDNVAGPGEPARYRMVAGDNRLRLALEPAQVAALQRAMILADRADLAQRLGVEPARVPDGVGTTVVPHEASMELSRSLEALRRRSLLRFSYKGSPRLVHPASVRFQQGQWYLSGHEDGDDEAVLKHFVVSRMGPATLERPGTAAAVTAERSTPLHPMLWTVDPPVQVVLRTAPDYVPDVVGLLLEPDERRDARPGGTADGVDLVYTVTHRAALRSRLYALGRRVAVVSPDEVRAEMVAELRETVGG